jgi:hypothetical protein
MRSMWNMSAIRRANKAAGHYYFSRNTLNHFNSTIYPTVYQGLDGVYFVTFEHDNGHISGFSVRKFLPDTGIIRTHGEYMGHRTLIAARTAAREAAGHIRFQTRREAAGA